MKIAVISDTHDHIWNFDKAVPLLAGAQLMLHCGDLIAPFMIPRLSKAMDGNPVHIVWGNNDGDKRLLTKLASEAGNVTIHGELALLEVDGVKIAMNHYPEIGAALAASGMYDLVCYGHDHTRHESQVGRTLLANPGELMGMKGSPSFLLFDTQTHAIEWVFLTP